MSVIFIVVFVAAFIFIVVQGIRVFKESNKITKMVFKQLEEDPYERAEKMAIINAKAKAAYEKEINPDMKALKCPNCGGSVKANQEKCEYCNAYLTKGAK